MKISKNIWIFLFIIGCAAPRNNPLDPYNKNAKIGFISGTVKSKSLPNIPLENVNIDWNNNQLSVKSNNDGFFQFENIFKNSGWLKIDDKKYSLDSVYINWEEENQFHHNFLLNSKPILVDTNFISIVQKRFISSDIEEIQIALDIYDSDSQNDIDTVEVMNIDYNFNSILEYNNQSKLYEGRFPKQMFGVVSLNEMIGKKFSIEVTDLENEKFSLGDINLFRVINQEVTCRSPINKDTSNIPHKMIWNRYEPGFQFTYSVEIYLDSTPPNKIWERKNYPSNEIIDATITGLLPGDYFWYVWVVDEFGNKQRSKPASFVVSE